MAFSDVEKRVLEVFVTSAEDPIYAIRHTVPPEVFGAFGSYFSRNSKDFRKNLLDAIYGTIDEGEGVWANPETGEEIDVDDGLMLHLLNKTNDSAAMIRAGLSKSQDFFKKWYGKYSHKSIANTVYIPMVATNVSQLFARELAFDQLAFFIEQSTRYVPWGRENMFMDPRIMGSRHAGVFEKAMDGLIEGYHTVKDAATEHYQREIPFENWLKWQDEKILGSEEKVQRAKYNREIRGAALDVARFLLPQAARTNIAWIVDARSTEFDVAAWKGHPLEEIAEAAHLIERHAGEIAPSLLKYTETNPFYSRNLHRFNGEFDSDYVEPFKKGVDIISSEEDALTKTVAHLLKRHGRGGSFRQRYREASEMGFDKKIDILRKVTEGRGSHDEWVEMDEDFDLTKITFAIRTDLGAVRDWRRHQKWDRGEALYTLDNGVHKPQVINDIGGKTEAMFNKSIERAYDAEFQISIDLPFHAQYVVPMAAMHEITMSAGLDQLQYMLWTRSTPEANFSYREDAFNLAQAVLEVHPWMLGYESYPEGKTLEQIFEEAPLKNLLRLQFGETALHT